MYKLRNEMLKITCLSLLLVCGVTCYGSDLKEETKAQSTAQDSKASDASLTGYSDAWAEFSSAVKKQDEEAQKKAFAKIEAGVFLGFKLWDAVKKQDHATVKTLLEQGADPNVEGPNIYGTVSVLCIALENKDEQTIKLLRQAKAYEPSARAMEHVFGKAAL